MISRATAQPVRYLFIDGGYLRECYARFANAWFTDDLDKENRDLNFDRVTAGMFKSFYYDCKDDTRRSGESDQQFRGRQQKQEDHFNRIQAVRGCHVQLGTLAGVGNRRRQKEVDILLTVDMMNHAIRQNMEHAYLLAGDRDFRPVVRSLVELGIFVTVRADSKDVAWDLIRAADNFEEISFGHYNSWTPDAISSKYRLPETLAATKPPQLQILRRGKAGKTRFSIYENGNRPRAYCPDNNIMYELDDAERLICYLQLQHGEITWDEVARPT